MSEVNKEKLIACLKTSRGFKVREEVLAFDDALGKLAAINLTKEDLIKLLMILEDNSEHEEVLWGLLHFIEGATDLPTFLQAFIEVVPRLIDQAPEWVETFHFRILNGEETRVLFKEMLSLSKPAYQNVIRKVLTNISNNELPPLSEYANFVLS
jgi:hypothetical protein